MAISIQGGDNNNNLHPVFIKLLQPVILAMNSKPVFQGSSHPTPLDGISRLTTTLFLPPVIHKNLKQY